MKNPHAVRETLTRSQRGFRVKFPSRKMNILIRCESLLERDAARFLEFSADVEKYYHNAEQFEYYDDAAKPRKYFPDFVAEMTTGYTVRIEVKPQSKLCDPVINRKYALIASRYAALGQHFKIFTDTFLWEEPRATTLRELANHRGEARSLTELRSALFGLKQTRATTTFRGLAEYLGSVTLAYKAIANGFCLVDVSSRLTGDSTVVLVGEPS